VKNLVAKLEVIGVRTTGERVELRLEIGRPREDGRIADEADVRL